MCDPIGAVKDAANWVGDQVPDWVKTGASIAFPVPYLANKLAGGALGIDGGKDPEPPKPPKPPGLPPDASDEDILRAMRNERLRSMRGGAGTSQPPPIPAGRPPSATGY